MRTLQGALRSRNFRLLRRLRGRDRGCSRGKPLRCPGDRRLRQQCGIYEGCLPGSYDRLLAARRRGADRLPRHALQALTQVASTVVMMTGHAQIWELAAHGGRIRLLLPGRGGPAAADGARRSAGTGPHHGPHRP
jgi:hypothetical protein